MDDFPSFSVLVDCLKTATENDILALYSYSANFEIFSESIQGNLKKFYRNVLLVTLHQIPSTNIDRL